MQRVMRHVLHNILFLAGLLFVTGKSDENVTSWIDDCSLKETSITCEHILPNFLPDNVSRVIVKDFLHFTINKETFTHKSWMTIQFLDITVNLHGKRVSLDAAAVKNVEFLCKRSTIIAVSVSIGLTMFCSIAAVTATVVYRRKQQRKARKLVSFLEYFKKGSAEQKFLAFLSFSSEDEGHEINQLDANLTESLKLLIGLEQELICVGNRQFNLGFPIIDEIFRKVSVSCVAIFVVTNNFCESNWCQTELREAFELNKPIILICKEEIDLTRAPPLMLRIFQKYTRAKLVTKEDGEIEISPDFEQLSKSIVKHASLQYEEKIK